MRPPFNSMRLTSGPTKKTELMISSILTVSSMKDFKFEDEDMGFEVERASTAAPSIEAVEADLSRHAHHILLIVLTLNRTITKVEIMRRAKIGETTWKKSTKELESKGWLIRRNHGGGGRGVWRHSRTFLRIPRRDPLA
jgi:hypothetical protein